MSSISSYHLIFFVLVLATKINDMAAFIPTQVMIKAWNAKVEVDNISSQHFSTENSGTVSRTGSSKKKKQSKKLTSSRVNAHFSNDVTQQRSDEPSLLAETIDENKSTDRDISHENTILNDIPRLIDGDSLTDDVYIQSFSKSDFSPLYGDSPNVAWRSVSMDDLRCHPLFLCLPEPEEVGLNSYEDLSLFRQDSWQWDALHQGRLTTSRLSAILGFYESKSAVMLQIPRSLQGHGKVLSAWSHLQQKPPLNWDHLRHSDSRNEQRRKWSPHSRHIWREASSYPQLPSSYPFSYVYTPYPTSTKPISKRRINDPSDARMIWGSEQEATALLGVINLMVNINKDAKVKEVGMLLFESLPEVYQIPFDYIDRRKENLYFEVFHQIYHEQKLPLLGASPDGIISYPDGSLEVVEIKCHSPFTFSSQEFAGMGKFSVSFYQHSEIAIPTWHIPQIMMEMFCAGSNCRSAVLVSFYAGSSRFIRIPRDDDYLAEMFYWMKEYYQIHQKQPSNRLRPPEPNFLQPQGNERYAAFLKKTIEVAKSAILIEEYDASMIQRSPFNLNFFHT